MARPGDTERAVVRAPFGAIAFTVERGALVDVSFVSGQRAILKPRTPLAREVFRQLERYLKNPTYRFRLPLRFKASDHQRKVWRALQKIVPGNVESYGSLSRKLKSSPRAVGGACRANPLPVVIPCHRVVAASGLGGFMGKRAGAALRIKRWLLAHEGIR
jgi:methylated-DNA-[protein]-cysteine S-methyltransferase